MPVSFGELGFENDSGNKNADILPTNTGVESGDTGESFSDRIFGTIGDVFESGARTIGRAASERAANEITQAADKIRGNQGTPSQTQANLNTRFRSAVRENPLAAGGIGVGTALLIGLGVFVLVK